MNFRVFLLIAAMAAFGALWSSDARYQAEQVALDRLERARSSNVVVTVITGRPTQRPANDRAIVALVNVSGPRPVTFDWVVPSLRKLLSLEQSQVALSVNDEPIAPEVLLSRLIVVSTLGFDPGNGIGLVTNRASLAKARIEERFCLVRFRTRQAAYFAGRRLVAFLRVGMSTREKAGRLARLRPREIPVKQTQAPPAGGRQTR